ncbi:MAG: TauD/TfdA family dioxygenase [Pseudomonadota bacterium]
MDIYALDPKPLETAPFGALIAGADVPDLLEAGTALSDLLDRSGGLLVLRGMVGLKEDPEAFVRLAALFGPEVENIRETLTAERFFHPDHACILKLSNQPPVSHPPPPAPDRLADGALDVRHPQQTNWHTDQSYRRPPPDVTLLFGVTCPPPDQGQTLFADCKAAFDALDAGEQARLRDLVGLHAPRWIGRTPEDVRAGRPPLEVLPHQRPQPQPLVRVHPGTGRETLYLCQLDQMDCVDGPIPGLGHGPESEGAALIERLLRHITQPRFVYVHEWCEGDVIIADNRCLLHCATWYDADTHPREMWRCTVMGNPGEAYRGEGKSWLPPEGVAVMQGMEGA